MIDINYLQLFLARLFDFILQFLNFAEFFMLNLLKGPFYVINF